MFIELHRATDGVPVMVNADKIIAFRPYGEWSTVSFDCDVGTNLVATESYSEIKRMIRSGSN